MTDASIVHDKNGNLVALNGKDAVSLMRVQTIIQGIKMDIETNGRMQLTRGMTVGKLLKMATEYTGVTYKRTEKAKAIDQLTCWFHLMKSTIPTEER